MDAKTLPKVQMPNRGNFILSYPGGRGAPDRRLVTSRPALPKRR